MNNKFTTYLLYAFGEIILVVVGILIAVSIDDWNEERVNRQKEEAILNNLHNEFIKNKINIDSLITHHKKIENSLRIILDLINEPRTTLSKHNVDSLLYLALDYSNFSPQQSAISELISSGKMNLISSENLRMLIFDWVSLIVEADESYQTLDDISQTQTLVYLTKNGAMRSIDYYGLLQLNGTSKFERNNQELFYKIEFENQMDNQAWGVKNYLVKLERIRDILLKIIDETQPA